MASFKGTHLGATKSGIPERSGPGSAFTALAGDLDLPSLAHELNSLLDGSIRSLELARRELRLDEPAQGIEQRLHAAQQAMRSMARVLEQAMEHPEQGLDVLASPKTLEQEAAGAIATLQSLLDQHAIQVTRSFTEEASRLPAGLLGIVIANGLRNAVEAMIEDQSKGDCGLPRAVTMTASIDRDRHLVIGLTDNGPGISNAGSATRPNGHGIGLELSRLIVTKLGGTLQLIPAPSGCGAMLDIRIPLESISES